MREAHSLTLCPTKGGFGDLARHNSASLGCKALVMVQDATRTEMVPPRHAQMCTHPERPAHS